MTRELDLIFNYRKFFAYSLFLFCLTASKPVMGQNPTAFKESICEMGSVYPRIDAPEKFYFSRGDTIISIKIEKEQVYIQKFDRMSLSQVSAGKAENLPPKAKYEGHCELPGKLLFFYRNWVGEDSIGLYCREVDFTKGNLSSDTHHLLTVFYENHGKYREIHYKQVSFDNIDFFDLNISPDSSRFVIKYRKVAAKSGDDKDKAVIGLAAFDCNNNYTKMWHVASVLPVSNALSVFEDFTVDNSGNAFMIGWLLQEDKKKKDDAPAEHKDELLVYRYGAEITAPIITKINFTGKLPVDASIRTLPNGKILIAGYFRYKDAVHQGITVNSRPELRWGYNITHGIFVYHLNSNG